MKEFLKEHNKEVFTIIISFICLLVASALSFLVCKYSCNEFGVIKYGIVAFIGLVIGGFAIKLLGGKFNVEFKTPTLIITATAAAGGILAFTILGSKLMDCPCKECIYQKTYTKKLDVLTGSIKEKQKSEDATINQIAKLKIVALQEYRLGMLNRTKLLIDSLENNCGDVKLIENIDNNLEKVSETLK